MKLWFAILLLAASSAFADANAVARGLAWLAAQQHADGSWSTNTALNALPLLAHLSAGRELDGKLEKAVRSILSQQSVDGAFTNGGALMYGHGMTTLLLAEITGMSREGAKLRPHLEKAVRFILQAQAVEKGEIHTGGWRYFPDSKDSDLAVSIWQIAALRAALVAGIRVPQDAMDHAAHYIARCQRADGGFAYQPGGLANAGRTAAGICALRMCGRFDAASSDRGRAWLQAHPLQWEDEYVYHSAMFCAQIGMEVGWMADHQAADGSWPAPPNCRDEADAGALYTTSMAILALTAKDKYLPVFSVND